MPKTPIKRTGVITPLVLITIFLFLIVFSASASAAMYGDVNNDGAVNVYDVLLVRKHVLGFTPPLTAAQQLVADVNGDGDINVLDVNLIMQMSLGIINEFPVLATPVLTAPSDGAVVGGTSISFQWAASSGAKKYQLEVIRASDNTVFKTEAVGAFTSATLGGFPNDGSSFRWRVRAGNDVAWGTWTASRNLVNGIAPAAPALLSPADTANVPGATITFEWNLSGGADKYELEIRKTSDNTIFKTVSLGNVSASMQAGFPQDGTQYRWRVRAGNQLGWGAWSDYRVFNNGILPPAPVLSSPANNANVAATSINFQWAASSGANNYQLEVIRAGDSAVFKNEVLGNTTSSMQDSFPNDGTLYWWRVRAGNDSGWGAWSAYRNLTNGAVLAPPALKAPADNATSSVNWIQFEWELSSGANKYELEIRNSDDTLFRTVPLGNTTATQQLGFLDDSLYKWRVRAGNNTYWSSWSAYRSFIIGKLLAAPGLTLPVDNARVSGETVAFQWFAVTGASKYQLQVIRVSDGAVFKNQVLGNVTTQAYSDFPNDGTQFKWRVRAGSDIGWGAWSGYRNFLNESPVSTAPAAPVLISPANDSLVANEPIYDGEVYVGSKIDFVWAASTGAINYQLQVVKVSDGVIVVDGPLGNITTSAQTGFPNDGTEFLWRVRAGNATDWGAWSFYRIFTNGFWWLDLYQ